MPKDTETVMIKIVCESQDLIPHYATDGAAGADLKAHLKEPVAIPPGGMRKIPTGIRLEIPQGFEMQIRPRSGLAANFLVTVLNAPGTIDSDYRGEIIILLINHGEQEFVVSNGMRIAQMVVTPAYQARFIDTEAMSESVRGEGRFGHTGTH